MPSDEIAANLRVGEPGDGARRPSVVPVCSTRACANDDADVEAQARRDRHEHEDRHRELADRGVRRRVDLVRVELRRDASADVEAATARRGVGAAASANARLRRDGDEA